MPAVMNDFRPHRSLSAPNQTWKMPQVAGYTAASTAVDCSERPLAVKSNGKSPQATPSFRLFTNPAWLTLNKVGSAQVGVQNRRRLARRTQAAQVFRSLPVEHGQWCPHQENREKQTGRRDQRPRKAGPPSVHIGRQ
jgi:hypothetical protein